MGNRHLDIKSLVPRKDGKYQQGYYHLINFEKYIGDPGKIIFRSGYERRFATYCDINDRIVKWSSEPLKIEYFHPVDKVMKPYNVDFYVKIDKGNNVFNEYIVEVKPAKQLKKPKQPEGRMTEKKLLAYNSQLKTYIVNMSKFQAAKVYAEGRGWSFVVVSESFIFS